MPLLVRCGWYPEDVRVTASIRVPNYTSVALSGRTVLRRDDSYEGWVGYVLEVSEAELRACYEEIKGSAYLEHLAGRVANSDNVPCLAFMPRVEYWLEHRPRG